MDIDFNLPPAQSAQPSRPLYNPGRDTIIKVVGVGGGGSNAVNNMFRSGIKGVDFLISNTDQQALLQSPVPIKLALGEALTQGLGCGADPEVGRQSAKESLQEIQEVLRQSTRMLFITAGMGGGTGTGAAPVIAGLAREMGILTVGIVTTPFHFEGAWRKKTAQAGLEELRHNVDCLLVINNDNLKRTLPKNIRMKEAFLAADQVLGNAARGIAEMITGDGYINCDFADVRTIMHNSGLALMGVASAEGDNRAIMAAEEALCNPLLDNVDIHGATGILINITGSEDSMTLDEVETVGAFVQEKAGPDARIIFGNSYDNAMGNELRVTVVACGFKDAPVHLDEAPKPAANRLKPTTPRTQPREVAQATLSFEETQRESISLPERDEPQIRAPRRLKLDLNNPSTVKELTDRPAYARDPDLLLDLQNHHPGLGLSRTSLDTGLDGELRLRDNNSFLHDNVD